MSDVGPRRQVVVGAFKVDKDIGEVRGVLPACVAISVEVYSSQTDSG